MTEIEFLDPGPTGHPDRDGAGADPDAGHYQGEQDGPDLRRLAPALAAAVAWVLAAGLAVMASVSTLYTVEIHNNGLHQSIDVDSWGRYHAGGLFQIDGHQTRYAIVLVAAAAVLLAAALTGVVRLGLARHLAVGGTAAVAAAGAILFLAIQAARSTNRSQSDQSGNGVTLQTHTGAAVWLALAATVAAAGGIVLAFVLKPPAEPAPLEPGEDGLHDPPFPGDAPATAHPVDAAPVVPGGGGPTTG